MRLQKYGLIQDGKLILSESSQKGCKPVVFAEIPENFDQMTQCVFQDTAVDKGDYIDVGVIVKAVEPDESGEGHELL